MASGDIITNRKYFRHIKLLDAIAATSDGGWIDCLYFSTTTMTTVGYGDLTPHTDAGKMFTIVYIFLGVGIVLYTVSLLASHFVEVREEFWLERLGRIKFKQTLGFWEKIKKRFL